MRLTPVFDIRKIHKERVESWADRQVEMARNIVVVLRIFLLLIIPQDLRIFPVINGDSSDLGDAFGYFRHNRPFPTLIGAPETRARPAHRPNFGKRSIGLECPSVHTSFEVHVLRQEIVHFLRGHEGLKSDHPWVSTMDLRRILLPSLRSGYVFEHGVDFPFLGDSRTMCGLVALAPVVFVFKEAAAARPRARHEHISRVLHTFA
mmetsp:Transcript_37714/g.69593  ORF Transcript_37714/g.69593 Transcript_37714/m.69593 type:complete len:205 (-) Transcript_37714:196-810(-)